jgi:hypothetical protein
MRRGYHLSQSRQETGRGRLKIRRAEEFLMACTERALIQDLEGASCVFFFSLGAGVATANFTYSNHSQMTRVFMCLYHVLQDDSGNDLPYSILFKSTDLIQNKGSVLSTYAVTRETPVYSPPLSSMNATLRSCLSMCFRF